MKHSTSVLAGSWQAVAVMLAGACRPRTARGKDARKSIRLSSMGGPGSVAVSACLGNSSVKSTPLQGFTQPNGYMILPET